MPSGKLSQKLQCRQQLSCRLLQIEWGSEVLFAEFLTFVVHRYRYVRVARARETQEFLQVELAWGGIEEIGTAHDTCDVLKSVIDDYRQLICKQAIFAAQNKIPALAQQILLLWPLYRVHEFENFIRHHDAQRSCCLLQLAQAAAIVVDPAHGLNLHTGAITAVDEAALLQIRKRVGISAQALTLVEHWAIPVQAERFECQENLCRRFRRLSSWIEVLHAQ